MSSYLDEIVTRKRAEVRARAPGVDLAELQRAPVCTTDVLGALRLPDRIAVIAEHKRKSPSKGFIRAESDPAEIGRMYEAAGAAAMSVLTDEPGFAGTGEDLRRAKAAVSIPVLCKDFIVSPLQVLEARAQGADIVLLIVAALRPIELRRLFELVRERGMCALIEVHDEHDLSVAARLGSRLIGVNNRNLHTFQVDLATSEELGPKFPADVVRVSESGIRTAADLIRLRAAGYDAALIGEQLMSAEHPGRALEALLG